MRKLLFVFAFTCGTVFGQAPDAMYEKPGTLVSVGTHRLNFYCSGSGSPTVVMEGGFADWAPAFFGLQERVAAFTRVCSYDRAGFGFSEPGPMPRSAERIADELHTALHNAGIPGPYLLVGLAFGSIHTRAFADRWMPEVAGLVLINGDAPDVEPPEMTEFWQRILSRRLPQVRLCRDWVAAGKPMPMPPPPEYPRLNCYSGAFRGLPDSQFSPELNAVLEDALAKKVPIWDTLISEIEQVPNDAAYLKEHRTSFGSRPVRIITATLFKESPATTAAARLEQMRIAYFEALAQSKLLDLSTNSKQIFSDTGILVNFEKPELVTDIIREVWADSQRVAK